MSKTYHISIFEHIHAVEKEHFWFIARNEMIRDLLMRFFPDVNNKKFLDVGCGTGYVMGELERMGFAVTGLDINARALKHAKKVTSGTLVRSSIFTYHPDHFFDIVGAFDLMEHIPNDTGFLARCRALLHQGGYVFLTVPAGQYLWSDVDVVWGHQRRYSRERLQTIVTESGFRIAFMGYWNSLLVPFYIAWRAVVGDNTQRYLKRPHYFVNRFLLSLLRFEGVGHFPFGATLVVVAQKI